MLLPDGDPFATLLRVHLLEGGEPEGLAEGEGNQPIIEANDQAFHQIRGGHRGNEDGVREAIAILLAPKLFRSQAHRLVVRAREPGERQDLPA